MNKTYRLIWSERLGTWIAAAEYTRSHGKRSGCMLAAAMLITGSALAAQPPASNALPTGAQYDHSQISIGQSGADMVILQGVDRGIINWNTYNIGSAAHVDYRLPSSGAVTLNRVTGGEMSQIFGRITSNGQFWLINSAGVLFGASSRVDVGGIVASTLGITDNDYNARRNTFARNGATGSIVNQGNITARYGGLIALLAPEIHNEGILTAQLGNVVLASGDQVTLDVGANGRLKLAVNPGTLTSLIENKQLIQADGGQVLMTAKAADTLAATVINNIGTVRARSLVNRNGRIILDGGDNGITR